MIKEWTRDYTTGAFIRWTNRGCPSAKEYEDRVRGDVYRRLAFLPPNLILIKADAAAGARKPLSDDFEACRKTAEHFEKNGKDYVAKAIREIYKGLPEDRPVGKRVLTERVRMFSANNYVSEITVYRGLKQARYLFAALRGISTGTADDDFWI